VQENWIAATAKQGHPIISVRVGSGADRLWILLRAADIEPRAKEQRIRRF
jgi:hypothetical protein